MAAFTLYARSLDETARVAAAVARVCDPGDVIVLSGALAAGKTQFVQFLGQSLSISDEIVSPTFTLANVYAGKRMQLLHIDAYRIETPDEFSDLALEDMMETHVTAIEWGETVAHRLPPYLSITLAADRIGGRRFTLHSDAPAWSARLAELQSELSGLSGTC